MTQGDARDVGSLGRGPSPGPWRAALRAVRLVAACLVAALPAGSPVARASSPEPPPPAATTTATPAFTTATLLSTLAAHPAGRARFVETKRIALLEQDVVSKGELSFTPPDRLEKRTLEPRPERLALEGGTLVLERGRRVRRVALASQPEIGALVESLRATLAGDRAALEQVYSLALAGDAASWTLDLVPKDGAVRRLVERIRLSGRRHQLHQVEIEQADGDRSTMTIEPLPPR